MQVTITRQKLLEIWNSLPILGDLKGFKLGYAVARTKANLKVEVESITEALKPSAEFQAYTNKRLELCRKYAEKDANNEPLVQGNQFIFGDNQEQFDQEMEPLNLEYSLAITDRLAQVNDYNACLQDKIIVEVHQIMESDISTNTEPTVAQMEILNYFME